MKQQRFKTKLVGHTGMETASITPPFDVAQVFGMKGRVPVKGSVNGVPFRSSLMNMGDGHMMVVNAELRAAAGCKAGDTVEVIMERDDDARTVEVPTYLMEKIKSDPKAAEFWSGLSFTHQKEYIREIQEAKRPETRDRRIATMMSNLHDSVRKK